MADDDSSMGWLLFLPLMFFPTCIMLSEMNEPSMYDLMYDDMEEEAYQEELEMEFLREQQREDQRREDMYDDMQREIEHDAKMEELRRDRDAQLYDMRLEAMYDSMCEPTFECGMAYNYATLDYEYECDYVFPCGDSGTGGEYVDTSIPYEDDIIICGENVYNCGSFTTYSEAKEVYDECGGLSNDVHHLDGDGDGIPCETLYYN